MVDQTINDAATMRPGGGTMFAGRYRIVRQLGQGGMGSVWLAEDTQLDNKPFAIKMLPSILVANKRAYRQLKDEALVAMKLTHPNIVTLRAFEENNGNPFLVMDYIDGQTLDDYLAEKGILSEEEVIRILRPIATALDYAHSEGVVHRDVKPANVMIRKDGHPFILDFGIAREIQETLTRVTGKLSSGTLLYMSPEQLHGAQPKKEQDIYSFAAMAYECLSGRPPFSRGQIEYQIDHDSPEPLAGRDGPIAPPSIAASVMAGLAKKPEDRPKSCAGVLEGGGFNRAERVERAETGGRRPSAVSATAPAVSSTAVGGVEDVSRKERKERWNIIFGVTIILGVLAIGGSAWYRNSQQEQQREQARIAAEVEAARLAKETERQDAAERERRKNWRIEGRQFTVEPYSGLNLTMKWCPAGTFTMGSPPSEDGRYDDERQHEVTLTKGFWLGETEVTQGQWKRLMNGETVVDLARKGLQDDTVYNIAGNQQTLRELWGMDRGGDPNDRCGDLKDDVPVYNVNWHEAVEFCRRLTAREREDGRIPDGYEYRLPTEAEWEYACRAGTTTALPNGRDIRILGENNAPALDDIAWYGGNSSVGFGDGRGVDTSKWIKKQYSGGRAFARAVKGKQANAWGLYDMIGNVWEWCGDWYGGYGYDSQTDPTGPSSGAYRVDRGGGWIDSARNCRSATRGGISPGIRSSSLGFRVALAPSH